MRLGNSCYVFNSYLAANHPDLVSLKMKEKMNIELNSNMVCGICSDLAEDAIVGKCKHVFCREDVTQYKTII